MNGRQLYSTSPGKYLQVEVSLQSSSPGVSPVVHDLSVVPSSQVNLGMLVYQNDFQGQVGDEWSRPATDRTPTGDRRFLGQFGNENVKLVVSNLPPHSAISVLFDLFVIRSWDGNSTAEGPDLWELNVGGGRKLISATFNNAPAGSEASGQSYPGTYPASNYTPRSGAAETNTLGFTLGAQGPMDSVYLMGYTVPHSASALELNFSASGLSTNIQEESWGVDNVRVFVTLASPARLVPMGADNSGKFQLELFAQPSQTYILEGSTNLMNWLDISTNQLSNDSLLILDPQSAEMPRRFYRARQVP